MTVEDEDDLDLPDSPLIGPHEGREVDLMLAGEKPLAYFYDFVGENSLIPDVVFEPHVRADRLVKREWLVKLQSDQPDLPPFRHVLLAVPEEAWRIDAAFEVINGFGGDRRRRGPEADVQLGRLLGYSEEAVDYFVERRNALKRAWQGSDRRGEAAPA